MHQTPRLKLIRLTESQDHLQGYHSIWSDPHTTRWSSHGPCKTLEETKEWMSALLLEKNPDGENYAVILRDDIDLDLPSTTNPSQSPTSTSDPSTSVLHPGGFLGWIGTWTTQPKPELGFTFHRSAWGYGFATEALRGFMELYWKNRPGEVTLEAWCDSENEGSKRVLSKAGFHCEKVVRGDYVLEWMVPRVRDSCCFRIDRPDAAGGSAASEV